MKRHDLYLLVIGILIATNPLTAQVLPVGTPVLEDYYRRLQLMGQIDSTLSFTIRPLNNAALKQVNIFDPTGNNREENRAVQLMPVTWNNQVVSSYPYGWNDGPMIPATGFQTYLSTGIYAQYKFLSIQFKPEVVFAQNSHFDIFQGVYQDDWRLWWQRIGNNIDAPERFGTSSYTRFFPGQSSIRLNFHPISVGISTESLWWGPGMRNSLLMSNTAPGFLHATINTTRPVRTGIGLFEGQLVGGKLEASGFTPKILTGDDYHEQYYKPKPEGWRYFSGMVLTYQPKWVPGLNVGIINVFTVNRSDMAHKLGDYIPFFPSGSHSDVINPDNPKQVSDLGAQDRNFSIFARWAVPSVHFEIYGEYARNDHAWDVRDVTVTPNHSRSYIIGMRKIVPLQNVEGDLLQINAEVTQLEPPRTVSLRNTGPMYGHHVVRDGYTQLGQLLGAGVGMGNNLQSLNISWLRGIKQVGFQLERLVHNNDFLYRLVKDPRRNWVDLGAAFHAEWDYKRFLFTGRMQLTKAFNYQYRLEERPTSANFWEFNQQDKANFYLQAGMMYRF